MSARISRVVPPRGGNRSSQRRKPVFEVDLNVPPLEVNNDDVGTSSRPPDIQEVQTSVQGNPPQPQPVPVVAIDVDSFDDDVILSSPRAFAEAKNNSRRNRGRNNIVNVDLESAGRHVGNDHNKRQRAIRNPPIINCETYVNLETNNHSERGSGVSLSNQSRSNLQPPPPPPPPEPAFSCPVCMGPLVEEMTTKCGHIFCKACIKQSISAQGKCPTCRRKMTMKDTIRIYLPATSLTGG